MLRKVSPVVRSLRAMSASPSDSIVQALQEFTR